LEVSCLATSDRRILVPETNKLPSANKLPVHGGASLTLRR
jgi:hypothetical protein